MYAASEAKLRQNRMGIPAGNDDEILFLMATMRKRLRKAGWQPWREAGTAVQYAVQFSVQAGASKAARFRRTVPARHSAHSGFNPWCAGLALAGRRTTPKDIPVACQNQQKQRHFRIKQKDWRLACSCGGSPTKSMYAWMFMLCAAFKNCAHCIHTR